MDLRRAVALSELAKDALALTGRLGEMRAQAAKAGASQGGAGAGTSAEASASGSAPAAAAEASLPSAAASPPAAEAIAIASHDFAVAVAALVDRACNALRAVSGTAAKRLSLGASSAGAQARRRERP